MIGTNIQTTPESKRDGTVLIVVNDGAISEVISDIQLDVRIVSEGSSLSFPSRPLWEFLGKAVLGILKETQSEK